MKVKELIEKLEKFDESMEVMIEPIFAEPTSIESVNFCSDSVYGTDILIEYVGIWPSEEMMERYEKNKLQTNKE